MTPTPLTFAIPRLEDTEGLALKIARFLKGGDLLLLNGQLGAGKTYFAGALCRGLGLDPEEAVPSPTFTLVCEYETVPRICHADLYRLRSSDEVFELGLEERRNDGDLLVVEWGEPYLDVLGGEALILDLSVDPRLARLRASGARAALLLDEIAKGWSL